MRYKFQLVTNVQGPLIIDRRGGKEEKSKRDNGRQPITDAGSRGRKSVEYERILSASDLVI